MKTITKLNEAIKFIEDNLDEEIDISKIANHINLSKSHLMRSFNILTDKTIGEYIRDRKLTRAAKEILTEKTNIIDIALKYGYENHGAFSKAFKRYHGISPSQVLENENRVKSVPPLQLKIEIIGDEELEYKTIKKESFKLIGNSVRQHISYVNNKFWEKEKNNGNYEALNKLSSELGVLGICYGLDPDKSEISYMIGIEHNELVSPATELIEVPASKWAVFYEKSNDPTSIDKLWDKIYFGWFHGTDHVHADAPDLERYIKWDYENSVYEFEIWIPYKDK